MFQHIICTSFAENVNNTDFLTIVKYEEHPKLPYLFDKIFELR